jgi:hypothetical protein
MSSMQILRAINTVLFALEKLPHMFAPLEVMCQPLISQLLCEEGMDYFEMVLEMITAFTYFPPTISP